MSYKDMTFCQFWRECEHGEVCSRALTFDVVQDAETFGALIERFADKPGCFESKVEVVL